MKILFRWLKRICLLLLVLAALLAGPIVYVETMCRGEISTAGAFQSGIAPEHHRPESRTLMTYPEWHIVHAYDDYAEVIRTQDPHEFDYFSSITGFWTSLCALNKTAAQHGGVDGPTKQMVYVIGTSFTLEIAMKAAYEETLGRIAVAIRGSKRAALDEISAAQATAYAKFLQQVPWYKWDFTAARHDLSANATSSFRDRERNIALGLENWAKAKYAVLIGKAVASTGVDELTLRLLVTQTTQEYLSQIEGVQITQTHTDSFEVQTPRYRALTLILQQMAADGVEFIEIAGNDDILFTAYSNLPSHPDAIHSFARQGYNDYRHLILVKVDNLARLLRTMPESGLRLEHIHDY